MTQASELEQINSVAYTKFHTACSNLKLSSVLLPLPFHSPSSLLLIQWSGVHCKLPPSPGGVWRPI